MPTTDLPDTITIGGQTVHRLGYGAMQLTGDGVWGEPDDPDEAKRVLRRAVEQGVDFIDTADSYGPRWPSGSSARRWRRTTTASSSPPRRD